MRDQQLPEHSWADRSGAGQADRDEMNGSETDAANSGLPPVPPPQPVESFRGSDSAIRPLALIPPPSSKLEDEQRRLTRGRRHADGMSGPRSGLAKFTWLMMLLIVLLTLRYFVPYFIEEVQYAATRGRQRAEYEMAGDGLKRLPLEQISHAYQMVSQRVGPSVVHIDLSGPIFSPTRESNGEEGPPGAHPFFGDRHWTLGQGSGVIVDTEGYIVTNRHVVEGASGIKVRLSDGRTVNGRVVGVDELTDIAVLKIDADRLIAAEWGDSDQLQAGALVWAVGSPFGLDHSITFGILSGKNRAGMAGTYHQDFLQTDAAVNPGNSGGPLVDVWGRVIGINTAIVGQAYQGIGFAVPSNVARRIYDQIRASGQVTRGWLGVHPEEVTIELMERLKLPQQHGAHIVSVVDNPRGPSPARVAGVRPGDVVVRWNDVDIRTPTDLVARVAETPVGTRARMVVIREGETVELEVEVGERPSGRALSSRR